MKLKTKFWIENRINIIAVVILLILTYLVSGSNTENTKDILEKNGFTNIEVGGYAWGREGWNQTNFKATTCNGKIINGYVGYFFTKSNSNIVIKSK